MNEFSQQGKSILTEYPSWVLVVGGMLAALSVLPIPIVFILRRFQCLQIDSKKIAIRRNDTTTSTKEMMTDVDNVSFHMANMSRNESVK